jgi:hypothetical protein
VDAFFNQAQQIAAGGGTHITATVSVWTEQPFPPVPAIVFWAQPPTPTAFVFPPLLFSNLDPTSPLYEDLALTGNEAGGTLDERPRGALRL